MLVTSEPHRKAAVKNGRRRGVKKKPPVDGTEVIPDARSLIPQLCVKAVGVCVLHQHGGGWMCFHLGQACKIFSRRLVGSQRWQTQRDSDSGALLRSRL